MLGQLVPLCHIVVFHSPLGSSDNLVMTPVCVWRWEEGGCVCRCEGGGGNKQLIHTLGSRDGHHNPVPNLEQ